MEAGPAASWKGFLGELCFSDEGPLGPAVPPSQEGGPLLSGLCFLVENVRGTVPTPLDGRRSPLLAQAWLRGYVAVGCPHPSGSQLFAPSHRILRRGPMAQGLAAQEPGW